MPLGRTNTEHFTMNPVYGANLYQPVHGRRVSQWMDEHTIWGVGYIR